jgi:hypothetical protein
MGNREYVRKATAKMKAQGKAIGKLKEFPALNRYYHAEALYRLGLSKQQGVKPQTDYRTIEGLFQAMVEDAEFDGMLPEWFTEYFNDAKTDMRVEKLTLDELKDARDVLNALYVR